MNSGFFVLERLINFLLQDNGLIFGYTEFQP